MNKKILSLLIILLVGVFTLTACNNEKDEKMQEKKIIAQKRTVTVSIQGQGDVAYSIGENKPVEFDEEPYQNLTISAIDGQTINLDAKAIGNYEFVIWMKNNKQYSSDSKISFIVDADTELMAVFG